MLVTGSNAPLRCFEVEISGTKICALRGERIYAAIPREQIRQISLCYDTDSKNPFCRYFLGFTLFSLGLIGLVVFFFASAGPGYPVNAEPGVFVLPMIPVTLWVITGIGFWILAGVFRARYFLLIESEKGRQKIFFEKSADADEIRHFIRKAHMYFGYAIEISLPEKTSQPS